MDLGLRRTTLVLMALLFVVVIVYVLLVSAGLIVHWPTYNTNYDQLADGFRSGKLSLPTLPPAELVAKENPYDPPI